jgi:putative ABC transport system permease protein
LRKYKIIPPGLAQRLLFTFLRDDLAEEVNGDLEEKFYEIIKNKSPWTAKLNYWYQVLHYIRPFAIRRLKLHRTNSYVMYKNYFKVSFRSLLNNKGYSLINVGGLAIGMAIAILIGLWVHDELSFDRNHKNYDRIVQVMQHQTQDGNTTSQMNIPMPLGPALRSEYGSDFKILSMATWTSEHILTFGDKSINQFGNFAEPGFPYLFSLEMLKGDGASLKDPTSVLLSESVAKALFGTDDPMNKDIRIDGKLDVKVTGVYKNLPYNSTFQNLAFIAPWEMYVNSDPWLKKSVDRWSNNSFQLFGQLAPEVDLNIVSEKIKKVKYNHNAELQRFNPEIYLYPISNWHLRGKWVNGINVGGQIQMVWLFGIIGAFVLLLACINFMNLSTARSEKRAKEVGIRMTIGSVRIQLINQFLSESFLVVLLSFIVAIGIALLSLSWFNELAAKQIVMPWSQFYFWLAAFVFVLFTSLLAGSYPALYLSSFRPVSVLKGSFKAGRFASLPRKVLVVVQFTVSVTLVIGTVIVYRQIQYSQNRPIGYDRDGLMMIEKKTPDFERKYEALRTALIGENVIEEMSQSSSPTFYVGSYNGGFEFEGLNTELQWSDFGTIWISPEYGKTVGWSIVQGRDASREFSTDSTAVLINETAAEFIGTKNPVGLKVKWDDRNYHIIGVVKDMIVESPYRAIKPTIYFVEYTDLYWFSLKLNPDKSAHELVATIERVFKKIIPGVPFDYRFADESYAKKFASEVRIGKLTTVFSALAIFISCLGIFGLASFVAEQRTKEIGIRKVLGASIGSLWQMLSKDFIALVMIASLLAIPLAIYFLNDWLKTYEYHTDIPWWIPFVSVSGALIITMVTVSFQAIRAARMNPVKSLRSE